MRTHIRDTSMSAYQGLSQSGHLGAQQQAILSVLKPGRDYTLQELVRASGLPINVVSGRCNELKKRGQLEEGAQRRCSITQRLVWPVRLPSGQVDLFL